jgi:hypothetical protein
MSFVRESVGGFIAMPDPIFSVNPERINISALEFRWIRVPRSKRNDLRSNLAPLRPGFAFGPTQAKKQK